MDIAMILTKKYKGKYWSLEGDDYEGLTWLSEGAPPTKEEIEAYWPEVKHEIDCDFVAIQRKEAYLQISDPLFFQYQRGEVSEQDWLDSVNSIKEMYPYPIPSV